LKVIIVIRTIITDAKSTCPRNVNGCCWANKALLSSAAYLLALFSTLFLIMVIAPLKYPIIFMKFTWNITCYIPHIYLIIPKDREGYQNYNSELIYFESMLQKYCSTQYPCLSFIIPSIFEKKRQIYSGCNMKSNQSMQFDLILWGDFKFRGQKSHLRRLIIIYTYTQTYCNNCFYDKLH
jgi:hypothetical protein